jgi:gamma-glutamyltranspeptidase/glutathione hydrolase
MVATSQLAATRAGYRALQEGGTAADAAIAAAAALCVCEPMSTGIGGDAFAIVWDGGAEGLDAAGPAARGARAHPVPTVGGASVTVPGAVAGWQALSERYGRLGLDRCLAPAVELAEHGFVVGSVCARTWHAAIERAAGPFRPAPRTGAVKALPALAKTIRGIAEEGPEAFYTGAPARAIAAVTDLDEGDLADFSATWVQPLRQRFRGVDVLEMPPPTQGVAVLEALALLDRLPTSTIEDRVGAVALALEDAKQQVRDGADVSGLLDPDFISGRANATPTLAVEPAGGTVYLCAVDDGGMAVSFIQSLYEPFGSGIVAPGTGVLLHNRGACFSVAGEVTPGRRPYHTLIPGLLEQDGELLGPFGVMGGFIQAQAHVQFLCGVLEDGLDPQAALDRPRFRVDSDALLLEPGDWGLESSGLRGYPTCLIEDHLMFGGGQAILRDRASGTLIGGSDSRKDGLAFGD